MANRKFFEKKTKEIVNRKTLRKACYQYCLDHTYNTPKGLLVNFYLPEENEFYRKLEAREYLAYIRVKKDEQYERYHKWLREYKKMESSYRWTQMMNYKSRRLYKEGGWYIRFLMKVKRYCTNRINKELQSL